jgi:hypothetical protein
MRQLLKIAHLATIREMPVQLQRLVMVAMRLITILPHPIMHQQDFQPIAQVVIAKIPGHHPLGTMMPNTSLFTVENIKANGLIAMNVIQVLEILVFLIA